MGLTPDQLAVKRAAVPAGMYPDGMAVTTGIRTWVRTNGRWIGSKDGSFNESDSTINLWLRQGRVSETKRAVPGRN